MNQLACNFAPLRFLPYRDAGEFVNVGVVVHCPQTDQFGYRLLPFQQNKRVAAFFPDLNTHLLETALQGIDRELLRLKNNHQGVPLQAKIAPEVTKARVNQFREVIRRREGLLHFGEAGTVLADTPEQALDNLFTRFVERQPAQKHDSPKQ